MGWERPKKDVEQAERCDDATFGVFGGIQTAEFDREAVEFAEAVASAIRAVESAVPGAGVVEVHRESDVPAAG